METAVNFYLESFADGFQSSLQTMMSFANLEMVGKPMDYYKTFRSRIQAVTKAGSKRRAEVHPSRQGRHHDRRRFRALQ